MSQLVSDRTGLLRNDGKSDFTIRCSDTGFDFRIRREILLGKSRYFDNLMNPIWAEGSQGIALTGEESFVVATILWFVYGGGYPATFEEYDKLEKTFRFAYAFYDNQFLAHTKLFHVADWMKFDDLKECARKALVKVSRGMMSDPTVDNFAQARQVVSFVFGGPTETIQHLKETIAWILNESTVENELELLFNWYAGLDVLLYRDMRYRHATKVLQCVKCHGDHSPQNDSYILVRDTAAQDPQWLKCACLWRGLCSNQCNSEHGWAPDLVYCWVCQQEIGDNAEFAIVAERRQGLLQSTQNQHGWPICKQLLKLDGTFRFFEFRRK